ncbi:MAG: metal-dependent transcriptional regulator, partial [Lachnospiraceae bacterium]|nr:metal-dependent transcriptional regulator [Lachnospiraceae bacterium]
IYERHTVLTKLFIALGVEEETATNDACRIEHYMSDETFDAIKAHMAKYGHEQ